jgi:Holliday junction resolvase RusA-like endonuclease
MGDGTNVDPGGTQAAGHTIGLTVPGTPTAKGRPRISTRGGLARAYTPAATRLAEDTMAGRVLALLEARHDRGLWPSKTALRVDLRFVLPIPPSWPAWRRAAALLKRHGPVGKPDLDNLVKLAKDALNGVLWVDDSQIVILVAGKVYGVDPCTEILATEVAHQTTKGAA